jgi:hypothetical protein
LRFHNHVEAGHGTSAMGTAAGRGNNPYVAGTEGEGEWEWMYAHPDLDGNEWLNADEINGTEDQDDDGNGKFDDYSGWDFVGRRGELDSSQANDQTLDTNTPCDSRDGSDCTASNTGYLRILILPLAASCEGALWWLDNDDDTLYASNELVPNVSVSSPSTHTIHFNSISGWTTPGNLTWSTHGPRPRSRASPGSVGTRRSCPSAITRFKADRTRT